MLTPQTETGMIAHAGVQCSIRHGAGRYVAVLVFDAHNSRFRRPELRTESFLDVRKVAARTRG